MQPLFAWQQSTLWARAMSAGVVRDPMLVTVGTTDDVTTERRSATATKHVGSVPHVFGEASCRSKTLEVLEKNMLNRNAQDSPQNLKANSPFQRPVQLVYMRSGQG
jgi:hypothetical protein